jgi:hypothetical protein
MHSEWPDSAHWQNAEDANFPNKVPKNKWQKRWNEAGQRFKREQEEMWGDGP